MNTNVWNIGENVFENGLLGFLIQTALVVAVTVCIVKTIHKTFKKQRELKDYKNPLMLAYIQKTIVSLIYIVALFVILYSITPLKGVGKAVLGATSILAVGVSLAAQESFSNFIGGFFLALYHPFKEGDYISLPEKNIAGYIQEISLRHTVISTSQNSKILIPNNVMNSAIVENKGFQDTKYAQFEYIGVSYDSDIDKVRQVICSVLETTDGILDERSAEEKQNHIPIDRIIIAAFDDSSVRLRYCIRTNSLKEYWQVAPVVRERIFKEFKKENIEIPYPITTVITKNETKM